MVVFDSSMMLLAIKPNVNPPIDEQTGKPVENAEARVNALIEELEKGKTKIIIPAPALSELLVRAGTDMQSIINRIKENAVFRIEPFDTLAAIEVAMMTRQAINGGNKRTGINSIWSKLKYDRQIVAIAKVHRATTIYSDDGDIRALGERNKIRILRLVDLPIPDKDRQSVFNFENQNKSNMEVSSDLNRKDDSNEENIKKD
jgi:predicted nucleic acid-binding protein